MDFLGSAEYVGRIKYLRRALDCREIIRRLSSGCNWSHERFFFSLEDSRLKDEMRRRAEELKEWAKKDRRNTHTERAVI